MKKTYISWTLISAIIMWAFPYLAVTVINGDAGMGICFILFYAVNPVYSVIVGRSAGKNMRYLWSLPVVSAVFFLLGVWVIFTVSEPLFIWYAAIYLVLGVVAMLIKHKSQK